jgi:hypothetical protein
MTDEVPNTRVEVIKRYGRLICRAVFVDYFYLTLVAAGLALSIWPALSQDPQRSLLLRTSSHIGDAILIAGVVTTFMRFFASLDIVGEKLESWLTSERYLEKVAGRTTRASLDVVDEKIRGWLVSDDFLSTIASKTALAVYDPQKMTTIGDLTKIWRNISLAMTRHAFPQIADRVYSKTLERLMEASEEYYLDDYRRRTYISIVQDDPNVVDIEHELSLIVLANQHNDKAEFVTRLMFDEFSDRKPEVTYFQVDGKEQDVRPQKIPGDRAGVDQFVLQAKLPAGVPVRIEYAYRFRQSLINDPFVMWTTTRYVRQARHEVNFSADAIVCTYQDTTFAALLDRDGATRAGRLVYVSRTGELIFPGSAFIFIIRRKSSSSHA